MAKVFHFYMSGDSEEHLTYLFLKMNGLKTDKNSRGAVVSKAKIASMAISYYCKAFKEGKIK